MSMNTRLRALRPGLEGWLFLLGLVLALVGTYLPVSAQAAEPAATLPGDAARSRVINDDRGLAPRVAAAAGTRIFMPVVAIPVARAVECSSIPGTSYTTVSVNPPPTDRPADAHADLNLSLRGYNPVQARKALVDYGGGSDSGAPQLPGLFADKRTAAFGTVYQVYDWNWSCNCRGSLLTNPEVTLAGLATRLGETIHVPGSGYSIGSLGDGYEVLVLYASADHITLKYTREDNVVRGYTLHVEGICVDPNLLALYQSSNSTGRGRLPALRAGQPFARARGHEIRVAVRDNGAFMDPRSRKDWWQGR
ncbi:MAG: hypothetical protein M5U01_36750 [Ardenticatenaceae bacterium]|nr:hypothetical protein [Ardenticatenaceae bacterium]